MFLRRFIEHIRKQEWTAVALDFVVVVVGVFVGLQVDNWNQERADSKREAFYLAALQDDFSVVIAELESDIAHYEEIANSMTLLIDQSRKAAPDASLDALNAAARQLIVMEGTPIVSDTYSNLTGSGDLAIIKSQALKNRMSSFFGQAQVVRLVGNTHEMQLVDIFQRYIIENLDYTTMFLEERAFPSSAAVGSDRILSVLPTAEFRNVAAVKWDIVTDIRGVLLTALNEARAVESLLAEELDKKG
jgi:hypothetical protein